MTDQNIRLFGGDLDRKEGLRAREGPGEARGAKPGSVSRRPASRRNCLVMMQFLIPSFLAQSRFFTLKVSLRDSEFKLIFMHSGTVEGSGPVIGGSVSTA